MDLKHLDYEVREVTSKLKRASKEIRQVKDSTDELVEAKELFDGEAEKLEKTIPE